MTMSGDWNRHRVRMVKWEFVAWHLRWLCLADVKAAVGAVRQDEDHRDVSAEG